MKKTNIPFKNYVILFITIIGTILLCLYIAQWYKKAEENSIEPGILAKQLPQVTIEEFENYVMENPNVIVYVSASTDETAKRFEKNIYDFIIKENLRNYFVYIDANKTDQNTLVETLKRKDDKQSIYTAIPNMYVIKDGKIEGVLYTKTPSLHAKEAIRFIKKQDIVK